MLIQILFLDEAIILKLIKEVVDILLLIKRKQSNEKRKRHTDLLQILFVFFKHLE